MHRRALRAGFTIIELLMVMAIIAIISAVALPKLDFRTFKVDAAARGLASQLAAAQRQAVTNQSNVNVLFDTVTNAIKVHEDVNNDNIQDPTERVRRYPLGDGVVFGVGSTPTRVYTGGSITFTRKQGTVPELIFRRDGSASESGAAYLTSLNSATNGRTKDGRSIEVILATGRVAWYKYVGTTWVRKF
ncbi:MAG TPA: GspH/FimT family protein [Gemmatimonadales bacterium]